MDSPTEEWGKVEVARASSSEGRKVQWTSPVHPTTLLYLGFHAEHHTAVYANKILNHKTCHYSMFTV